jgi:hypothetical protein
MAKSKKQSSEKTKSEPSSSSSKRKLANPHYKSFRLQKKIKPHKSNIKGAASLFRLSFVHILKFKRHYLLVTAIFFLLNIFLVKGLTGTSDIELLKETFDELFVGATDQLATGLTLFGVLLGSVGSASSDVASLYQSIIIILASLVVIWSLRQLHAGEKISVKGAFYKSTYPLIPFLLVLLVIGIQLLPLAVAGLLYAIVFGQALAVTVIESALWLVLIFLLVVLSLYMIVSSVFAAYIVTLPDVTPMQSLRSARDLVRHRRWTVMRKMLFLPLVLVVAAGIIMIPVILFITPVAEFLFLALSMFSVVVIHSYLYSLYRELL